MPSETRMFKARYTRLHDRILATVWPPKRRHLRLVQALVDSNEQAIQQTAADVFRDLTLHGNAYVLKHFEPGPDA